MIINFFCLVRIHLYNLTEHGSFYYVLLDVYNYSKNLGSNSFNTFLYIIYPITKIITSHQ